MPSNITPSTDSFTTNSMKPAEGEEVVAFWGQKIAANTGYLAGLQRTVFSDNSNMYLNTTMNGFGYSCSRHFGYIDAQRHKGTLAVSIYSSDDTYLSYVRVYLNGTTDPIFYNNSSPSNGVFYQGVADLSAYISGDEGELVGTFIVATENTSPIEQGPLNVTVSVDLYCHA